MICENTVIPDLIRDPKRNNEEKEKPQMHADEEDKERERVPQRHRDTEKRKRRSWSEDAH